MKYSACEGKSTYCHRIEHQCHHDGKLLGWFLQNCPVTQMFITQLQTDSRQNYIPKDAIASIRVHPSAYSVCEFLCSIWRFSVLFAEQVMGVTSKELIPKGTRFGPLVGESYTNETLLKDANRKYFWRVSVLHVSLWICVLACEIHLFGFQNCSHPVSPSGDAAVAMVWHRLAVVVIAWHPVKVWLCLLMSG